MTEVEQDVFTDVHNCALARSSKNPLAIRAGPARADVFVQIKFLNSIAN